MGSCVGDADRLQRVAIVDGVRQMSAFGLLPVDRLVGKLGGRAGESARRPGACAIGGTRRSVATGGVCCAMGPNAAAGG